ncbi:MAG TPA: DUF1549 and DUF1553 domain-containing protein [Pirellulales bacterium]|nr:DUF1549 and DUF1553 domain-containing protein [Pirellulales bacterium]
MRRLWMPLALFLVAMGVANAHGATAPIVVEPLAATLTGNFARVQLQATRREANRALDVTREARYSSLSPQVVSVSDTGQVTPLANGAGRVRVECDGKKIDVPVTVAGVVAEPVVSFREDVIAAFNRLGCSQGACHAAQYGQGGFKLSLLGYAPEEDYPQLVRDRFQRRVALVDPAESLFLKKATNTISHRGGCRMKPGSYEYELLKAWVACGAPGPKADEPEVVKLIISPAEAIYRIGDHRQLRIEGRYSDGTTRDITHRVKYDSLLDGVVQVDATGYMTVVGAGQGAVMIRYLGQADVSLVVTPFRDRVDLSAWKPANLIDELVADRWQRLGLKPAGLCSDEQFMRRAYLDAIGTLPAPEAIETFVKSRDPNKRTALVDELLGLTGDPARDRFVNEWVAFWSLKWGDLLLNNSKTMGSGGMWALNNWIRQSLREHKPMDQFACEVITAEGSTRDVGPANFFLSSKDPVDLAETTTQVFLGVRLQCAKCHHHPFEAYSQHDYYGLAAFFARFGSKTSADFGSQNGGIRVIKVSTSGTMIHPRTKEAMQPTPLGGKPIADADVRDPRKLLADWLVGPGKQMFARNIANRIWGYYMGTGIIDPVDDVRATNPPSNPALLDALAQRFIDSGYDLRQLMRLIMTSRVYQLSSTPPADMPPDARFYTHYNIKRLGAEVLLDAIDYACGTREKFAGVPLGTRAIELPDPNYASYFLDTLGRPLRASACECERSADPNLAQALQIANGELINRKLDDAKGRIAGLIGKKTKPEAAIAELYLATVSRRPSADELQQGRAIIERAPSEREGLQDLLWALCNSREFLFNH